ncbi:hypothetical protein FRB97_003397 [Tulasnella sp. 331]|nr:hypothetical protein FRB97_003397 [Tulasnella sp. 331]KAG8882906.1 hypothetical protein FRB98_003402 [Tulasnella sp. 332]
MVPHNDPPSLYRYYLVYLRRRPQQTSIVLICVFSLLLLHAEWAYFAPRIFLSPASLRPPDEDQLPLKILASEARYQSNLKARQEMIHRYGPEPSIIEAFPGDIQMYTVWDFFQPAFNCPHTVERIGTLGVGGKWVCGLDRIAEKEDCVVYSFGSSWESSFEAGLLRRTKHCKVYGYHYDSKKFGPEVRWIDRLGWRTKFQRYGLSWTDEDADFRTLPTLMFDNGHDFVDLVVIDIEGWEFPALTAVLQSYAGLTLPFGQLQVEIHMDGMEFSEFQKWWEALEAAGLRPFFSEPNMIYHNINRGRPDISEYSFLNIRGSNAFISNDHYDPSYGRPQPTLKVAGPDGY